MAVSDRAPLWINLEYLSAEAWVEGCHRLTSPHGQLPLHKTFFFPGFGTATGGLLREHDLFSRRDAFRASPSAQARMWSGLGVPVPQSGERRISLFGYQNAAVDGLLECLAEGPGQSTLLVPEGLSVAAVARWFGAAQSACGAHWRRGRLTAWVVPFTEQSRYDELLWACDVNLVRGEDSLVRALWAGRPLLWQLYPQAQQAHLDKLEAFVAVLGSALGSAEVATAMASLLRGWNRACLDRDAWQWLEENPQLAEGAFQQCAENIARGPELADSLVRFVDLTLK